VAVGDEHWMCLVAHAVSDVRPATDPGLVVAWRICDAYLRRTVRFDPKRDGQRVPASSGGGVNEAILAFAWDSGEEVWRRRGLAYADVFLAHQFRPSDAGLLGGSTAMVGGFRNGMHELDVQIDTVQHVGSSLLSAVAVLRGAEAPGLLP